MRRLRLFGPARQSGKRRDTGPCPGCGSTAYLVHNERFVCARCGKRGRRVQRGPLMTAGLPWEPGVV